MTKPLKTLQKMRGRSLDELRTRGAQAVSAYREQMSHGRRLPSDDEFKKLLDTQVFGTVPVNDSGIKTLFFDNSDRRFFESFTGDIRSDMRELLGDKVCRQRVSEADSIVEGRFDLLGYKGLFVGRNVDWHLEPISGIRSPTKHWKEFDELDITETGDKKVVWEINRHQHFFKLGVAYRLTGNEEYAQVFAEHLESWIRQNPPGIGVNWMSSLEVAFRSISWIWALNLFRDSEELTSDLVSKAVKGLYIHGRHIEKYLSKYYSPNTHLTGEALGLYYLGTQLPFLERAKHWRKLGEQILLDEVTRQFYPDGVYFEQSSWYHRYSVDFYLHFLTLRDRIGESTPGVRNISLNERLAAALDLMMHITRPDGSTPLIGDDDGGRMLPLTGADPDDFRGTLAAGALRFGSGEMKFVAGASIEEIFWLNGKGGALKFEKMPAVEPGVLSKAFTDGGYFVMRDGWTSTDDHMVVDCGPHGALSGGHGHADALSFDLSLHGHRLFVDPGTYTYHESKKMRELFRHSSGHNTLTVDGRSSSVPSGAFSWEKRVDAELQNWITEPRFDFFCGIHRGFSTEEVPATHQRSILNIKGDYTVLRDLMTISGEHQHTLSFHYGPENMPKIDIEGRSAGDRDHRLFVFADNGKFVQKESWISSEYGNKQNAPLIRHISLGKGTQEMFTFILPWERKAAMPQVSEINVAGGRAFVIKYLGNTDLLMIGDGETRLRTNVISTDFEWTWSRLTPGENVPDEIVAVNGSRLSISISPVVRGLGKIKNLSARRLGQQLNISTDIGLSTVSISDR